MKTIQDGVKVDDFPVSPSCYWDLNHLFVYLYHPTSVQPEALHAVDWSLQSYKCYITRFTKQLRCYLLYALWVLWTSSCITVVINSIRGTLWHHLPQLAVKWYSLFRYLQKWFWSLYYWFSRLKLQHTAHKMQWCVQRKASFNCMPALGNQRIRYWTKWVQFWDAILVISNSP